MLREKGRRKDFFMLKMLHKQARETNMTFPEEDMIRAMLVWIRTRLLRRNLTCFPRHKFNLTLGNYICNANALFRSSRNSVYLGSLSAIKLSLLGKPTSNRRQRCKFVFLFERKNAMTEFMLISENSGEMCKYCSKKKYS